MWMCKKYFKSLAYQKYNWYLASIKMCRYLFYNNIFFLVECRIQQIKSTIYVVSGESVTLPCAVPGLDTYLKWRFQQNGSDFVQDAAQVFPGGIPSIFNQFDLPP